MMKKHLYLVFLFSVFISCDYVVIENKNEEEGKGDKKPSDFPVFPEHSNPEIEIISMGYKIGDLYKNTDSTFLALGKISDNNTHKSYVFELDHNMVKLDSVSARGVFKILEDGSFFTNGYDGEMFKYQTIKSTPINIILHPFNARKYRDETERAIYIESFDKNGFPDISIYKSEHRVDSLSFIRTTSEFKKQVLKNLKCISYIRSNLSPPILFFNDNKMYIGNDYLSTYPYDFGLGEEVPHKLLKKVDSCELNLMKSFQIDYNTNISLVDDYVTGYGSAGGNHFSPGTRYEKGLQYFNLEVNGVTTSFRVYAPRLSTLNIKSRNIPHTDICIIDVVRTTNEYPEELNSYIARIKK